MWYAKLKQEIFVIRPKSFSVRSLSTKQIAIVLDFAIKMYSIFNPRQHNINKLCLSFEKGAKFIFFCLDNTIIVFYTSLVDKP
jgi:hypothetical protein